MTCCGFCDNFQGQALAAKDHIFNCRHSHTQSRVCILFCFGKTTSEMVKIIWRQETASQRKYQNLFSIFLSLVLLRQLTHSAPTNRYLRNILIMFRVTGFLLSQKHQLHNYCTNINIWVSESFSQLEHRRGLIAETCEKVYCLLIQLLTALR